MLFGSFEDVDGAGYVVRIVLERQLRALTNGLESGKVNDAVNASTFCNALKRLEQGEAVSTIHFFNLGLKPQNGVQSYEHLFFGVGKIIEDNRRVSGIYELHHGVRADVPCPSGYDYTLFHVR